MVSTAFTSKIISKENLNEDTIKLVMTAPADFSFEAGSFALFKMEKKGIQKYRAYSFLTPFPKKGTIEFCIKLIPDGFASKIFRETKVKDKFEIKGPFTHFPFKKSKKEPWFLCIGVGIVPFYCLLQKYLSEFPQKKFTLVYSVRKRKDLLFHRELKKMEQIYPNFTYIPSLTREKWKGRMGRAHLHLGPDLQNKVFYLCGLKGFILGTKEYLLVHKVKQENIIT